MRNVFSGFWSPRTHLKSDSRSTYPITGGFFQPGQQAGLAQGIFRGAGKMSFVYKEGGNKTSWQTTQKDRGPKKIFTIFITFLSLPHKAREKDVQGQV